jgi:hypothetical protein
MDSQNSKRAYSRLAPPSMPTGRRSHKSSAAALRRALASWDAVSEVRKAAIRLQCCGLDAAIPVDA